MTEKWTEFTQKYSIKYQKNKYIKVQGTQQNHHKNISNIKIFYFVYNINLICYNC